MHVLFDQMRVLAEVVEEDEPTHTQQGADQGVESDGGLFVGAIAGFNHIGNPRGG